MLTEFNLEQAFANDVVTSTTNHIYLTGPPGSGKSYTLRKIITSCRKIGKKTIVVAPTGVAAMNLQMGATTIHSTFGLPLSPYLIGDPAFNSRNIRNTIKLYDDRLAVLKSVDVIILDECSMIRADIMDCIDQIMRVVKGNSEPFGSVQVILSGDSCQLSPVATHEDWEILKKNYKTVHFFSSRVIKKLIKSDNLYTIELSKIYRQEGDSRLIELLTNCRFGKPTKSDIKLLNSKLDPFLNDDSYVKVVSHNHTVDKINKQAFLKNPNPSKIYKGRVDGKFPYKFGKPKSTVKLDLELKVGCPIMVMSNSRNGAKSNYVNGEFGIVKELRENEVVIESNGVEKIIEQTIWENCKYVVQKGDEGETIVSDVLGSFHQIPLRLSAAISGFKSQGATIPKLAVDCSKTFAPGEAYVMLSRAVSLDGLVLLRKVKKKNIFSDPVIEKFSAYKVKKKHIKKYFQDKTGKSWKELKKLEKVLITIVKLITPNELEN